MNKEQFMEKFEELKDVDYEYVHDYRLELYRNGVKVGFVYADGYLDKIEIDDHEHYVYISTGTIGVLFDDAKLRSIYDD